MPHTEFHPLVRDWFGATFAAPTEVQRDGWRAINDGRHALLCAPTGSGKTLAAFLSCIDDLVQDAARGELEDSSRVVYVSPLKALSSDIRKNLEEPLEGIRALALERGEKLAEIRIAARTGDTKASERQRLAKTPPHVWITTPESLFILLGSDSGRRALASVRTVIVDEIHAVARDKRGAHLALSIERLEQHAGRPLQRIGLSATVSPIREVARLLVGSHNLDEAGEARCAIVDRGRHREMDLAIEVPPDELGPIASHELWAEVLDRIAALSSEHRTCLVFVNTRRLVERVAHLLSERLGDDAVVAHHGSLARATRQLAEERLKEGSVRVCVATASLELGIDIGHVDLVCQIGSPRSVAVALQRVGRSGHAVHATPKGRFFPLTRDELVECAALVRLARRGELDPVRMPEWPLDVLAQQVVAAAVGEEIAEDALRATVERAWHYRALPRERFDQVIEMLTSGFDRGRGRRSAMLMRDSTKGTILARRGARLATLTSGGAIPDNADYDVIAEPEGSLVGRLNEDFAIESSAGDIFLLGNTSWRIRRVSSGVVRVEDAHGAPPTIPFWLGEAPARTIELGAAIGALREEVDDRLERRDEALAWLTSEYALTEPAAAQLVAYIEEGKRILGVIPTTERIVAERFFDEAGGMQLVLHAPFGGRINRAWGLALRKKFCRSFDFELQASATDDGINLALGPQHSFPLDDVFRFVRADAAGEVLEQALLQSPIFNTRWRWVSNRSLAVLRFSGGRKVPPVLQRIRTDDLLGAVFPAQVACQDNAMPGNVDLPDYPLVFEAMRDCLTDALDAAGFADLLRRFESGEVQLLARDTTQPSVFSHQILNAMPYAFLDDAPLEERRARMVALRRALPEDARDLGRLDPAAIAAADADSWPDARDPFELHDALLSLVLGREDELQRSAEEAHEWLDELVREGRVVRLGDGFVCAIENADCARAARAGEVEATVTVLRGRSASCGPFQASDLAAHLHLPERRVDQACLTLEVEGALLRGAFTAAAAAAAEPREWCDRRILARIHRATIASLRREIEPVTIATYLRFLTSWQYLAPGSRGDGVDGTLAAIECLQGYEAAAGAWETSLLPARVQDYRPELLDRLSHSGEVVWGRFTRGALPEAGSSRRGPLTRMAPITLARRNDLGWLLDPRDPSSDEGPTLSSRAALVRAHLAERGASFTEEIGAACELLPSELEDALSELVAVGEASADGFAPMRKLARRKLESRRRSRFARRRGAPPSDGRWWLLTRPTTAALEQVEERAAQLLRRWGVLFRDLVRREPGAPAWRDILQVLRRAEARGEIRGGRFVAGRLGEQYALPEAVDALRKTRRQPAEGQLIVVSACDPINLSGSLTPGPRIPALPDNRLVLQDGLPIGWSDGAGEVRMRAGAEAEAEAVEEALGG